MMKNKVMYNGCVVGFTNTNFSFVDFLDNEQSQQILEHIRNIGEIDTTCFYKDGILDYIEIFLN